MDGILCVWTTGHGKIADVKKVISQKILLEQLMETFTGRKIDYALFFILVGFLK